MKTAKLSARQLKELGLNGVDGFNVNDYDVDEQTLLNSNGNRPVTLVLLTNSTTIR